MSGNSDSYSVTEPLYITYRVITKVGNNTTLSLAKSAIDIFPVPMILNSLRMRNYESDRKNLPEYSRSQLLLIFGSIIKHTETVNDPWFHYIVIQTIITSASRIIIQSALHSFSEIFEIRECVMKYPLHRKFILQTIIKVKELNGFVKRLIPKILQILRGGTLCLLYRIRASCGYS